MSAHVEITVQPPDVTGALALLAAVVAIDIACLKRGRSTISRWTRHQLWHRPGITLTAAALLGLHLAVEVDGDPFRWISRHITRGDA
jgi:hypothetical protein